MPEEENMTPFPGYATPFTLPLVKQTGPRNKEVTCPPIPNKSRQKHQTSSFFLKIPCVIIIIYKKRKLIGCCKFSNGPKSKPTSLVSEAGGLDTNLNLGSCSSISSIED